MRRDDGGDFACCIPKRLSCTACIAVGSVRSISSSCTVHGTQLYSRSSILLIYSLWASDGQFCTLLGWHANQAALGTVHIRYWVLCAKVHVYQRELSLRQRNRLRWYLQCLHLVTVQQKKEGTRGKGDPGPFEYMGERSGYTSSQGKYMSWLRRYVINCHKPSISQMLRGCGFVWGEL